MTTVQNPLAVRNTDICGPQLREPINRSNDHAVGRRRAPSPRAARRNAKFLLSQSCLTGSLEIVDSTRSPAIKWISFVRWAGCAAFVMALLVPQRGKAEEITISAVVCGLPLHVIAHHATLSEVLAQMAARLGFTLKFEGNSDPLLDIDLSQEPSEVIAKLAGPQSFIIRQMRDPQCKRRQRITAVWILPAGQNTLSQSSVAPPPSPKQVPMTPDAQAAMER